MKMSIELKEVKGSLPLSESDRKKLMQKIAAYTHSCITYRIVRGITPSNAPLTTAVKQGDKTLRDNGKLLSSFRWRASASEAVVSSNHIAAILNNPEEAVTFYTIRAKKAKYLTLPAGSKTRTLMRKYGFSAREVLDGLRSSGYSVYRPYCKGTKRRANVIMAILKEGNTLKSGKKSLAKKFHPFAVFILKKEVHVPLRRFMYLDETELKQIDGIVKDCYGK